MDAVYTLMTDNRDDTSRPKRTSISFPAEVNKRGTAYYITVMKPYRDMMGIGDGDIVDVTLTLPKDVQSDNME